MDQKVLRSIASVVGAAPVLALVVQLELANPELGRLFGQIEQEPAFHVREQLARRPVDEQLLIGAELDLLLVHVALMRRIVQALLPRVHRIDRHARRPMSVPEDERDLVAIHLVDGEWSVDLSAVLAITEQLHGRRRGVARFKITGQADRLAHDAIDRENSVFSCGSLWCEVRAALLGDGSKSVV